jgi:hypothetical protein
VAQRVARGIALLFHDRGTRRGRVVSSTPRPYFTPGKDTVPIVQEAGWALGPVWTGGKSRPTGIRSPVRPARSQSLYQLSYPAHISKVPWFKYFLTVGYSALSWFYKLPAGKLSGTNIDLAHECFLRHYFLLTVCSLIISFEVT